MGVTRRQVGLLMLEGFGYKDAINRAYATMPENFNPFEKVKDKDMDIQPHEIERCKRAGAAGGAYLDSIRKYDLKTLSQHEWDQFIQCVCMDFMIPF